MNQRKESTIHTSLVVGSTIIPYTITTSSQRKTLFIRVRPPGIVEVRVPVRTPTSDVVRFVEGKRSWIFDNVRMMQERSISRPKREYIAGEIFLFLGREYHLVIEEGDTSAVLLRGSELVVIVPKNRISSPLSEWIKDRLYLWYLDQARELIKERIGYWANHLGVSRPMFTIRNQKTQWGSCSPKNTLSINVQLLMAPLTVIDYLVLHELCHIVHKNHSPDFWDLIRSNMPDYKRRKEELKKYEGRCIF